VIEKIYWDSVFARACVCKREIYVECVCVCDRYKDRERECVCERERGRERERD
jgi:hypothetical protein